MCWASQLVFAALHHYVCRSLYLLGSYGALLSSLRGFFFTLSLSRALSLSLPSPPPLSFSLSFSVTVTVSLSVSRLSLSCFCFLAYQAFSLHRLGD
jgi:hypothetical protein